MLLHACTPAVPAPDPFIVTPTPTAAATGAGGTPAPERAPLYDIPTAAWSFGMGESYQGAPRPRTAYGIEVDDGPVGGVPLGGLGAGSIGRTPRGDFARWHLDVGTHHFEPLLANQFSVFVQQGDQRQAHVLSPYHTGGILPEWNWDMPPDGGRYYALFPKAWYTYEWDGLPVRLAQKQFSPVIPNNYRESSYPAGVFEWKVENPTSEPLVIGIMFTWQNLVGHGWGKDEAGGNVNRAYNAQGMTGIVFTRGARDATEEWHGTFAILTPNQPDTAVTYRSRFLLSEGRPIWSDFSADGELDNVDDSTPTGSGQSSAGALAVTAWLAPGEVRTIPFALAWDFPVTEFGDGTAWYKRYTAFYGTTGRRAWSIAADTLAQYPQWEQAIDTWQRPILDDPGRPMWYKTALFNELYYLVDGGTLWEHGRVGDTAPPGEPGRFAVLECPEYDFYSSFDVDFYGSFALAALWPELEKRVMRDFAATVPLSDTTQITVQATGRAAELKVAGAVPHDLGTPRDDPLLSMNTYNLQNSNVWKDLNAKFALRAWRDYVYTRDAAFAHDVWPAVAMALDYLSQFDLDHDGLLDHDGTADQTYDTWTMKGPSAYGGSLWLAALEAGIEFGKLEGDAEHVARYGEWLAAGKVAFEAKLWNGGYYLYDGGGGPSSTDIMADQLAGQWYADLSGLAPIAPGDHVETALHTIYRNNVLRFGDGEMGAVNGMRSDGRIDVSNLQSQESWTGVSYALAALMLSRGLTDEGWQTAWGVYNVTYNRGLWFRTPEAYDVDGNFRAAMYLRPLAIWSIEYAIR